MFARIVSRIDATIEIAIIVRQPAAPPNGRTLKFPGMASPRCCSLCAYPLPGHPIERGLSVFRVGIVGL